MTAMSQPPSLPPEASQLLISTRKGLFVAEPAGAGYRVARAAFVGDNVSLALVDPRGTRGPRGTWYAALDHGHFGVKLHRSDDGGATWTEIATPAYPEAARGRGREVAVRARDPVVHVEDLGARPGRRPGRRAVVRHDPRRAVPLGGSRRDAGTLVETLLRYHPYAQVLVRRRRPTTPGIHSILRRPARFRDDRRRSQRVRRRSASSAPTKASWDRNTAGRLRADVHPARPSATSAEIQDPHPLVQLPRPRRIVFWAQHHNGIFRSHRRHGLRGRRSPTAGPSDVRLRGRRRSGGSPTPPGSCPRRRTSSAPRRRAARRHAHARRRRDVRDAIGRPARSLRVRPGSIATRSRSAAARTAPPPWRSARPPATCSRAPTAARPARSCRTTCRPSTPSPSRASRDHHSARRGLRRGSVQQRLGLVGRGLRLAAAAAVLAAVAASERRLAFRSMMNCVMYGKPTFTPLSLGASVDDRPNMMTAARST